MSSKQLCHSHNHHNHIVYISSKQISIRCQCRTDSLLLYCLPLNHKVIFCYTCIRGCKRKWLTGYRSLCKLGAYYLVGVPVGVVLAFVVHLKGKGLWIGMVTGSTVQAFLQALNTSFTNWEKQVISTKKLILSIYLVLFLHLSTNKIHVQLDHIV